MKHMAERDELVRFGVSFPAPLIEQFDQYIDEQGYTNRSEAIRDMARRSLLEPSRMNGDEHVAGTIVLVYDHHVSDLPIVLMEVQHRFHHDIISNMHVHLNHDQCLEVIVVRGELARLRSLHRQIQAQKGVIYAELSVTYADKHDASKEHKHT
ncbi:nickel-responsive transcriptional regulator NikR [Paenibacillus endophyticus]